MSLPIIEAVQLGERIVVLDGGIVLPITNLFDSDGDECEPDEAYTGVAGTDEYGWITFTVSDEKDSIH